AQRRTSWNRTRRTTRTEMTAAAKTTTGMITENGSRISVGRKCMNSLFSCTNAGHCASKDLMAGLSRNSWRAGRLVGWALVAAAFSLAQISHNLDSPSETAAALAKKAKKA